MTFRKTYAQEEVKKLVAQEVNKAIKKKSYSYNDRLKDDLISGSSFLILTIIILIIIAALGF